MSFSKEMNTKAHGEKSESLFRRNQGYLSEGFGFNK